MKKIEAYNEYVDMSIIVTGTNTLGLWVSRSRQNCKRWQYGNL